MINLILTGPDGTIADGSTDNVGQVTLGQPTVRRYTVHNTGDEAATLNEVQEEQGWGLISDPSGQTIAANASVLLSLQVPTNSIGELPNNISFDGQNDGFTSFSSIAWAITGAVVAPTLLQVQLRRRRTQTPDAAVRLTRPGRHLIRVPATSVRLTLNCVTEHGELRYSTVLGGPFKPYTSPLTLTVPTKLYVTCSGRDIGQVDLIRSAR